MQALTCPPAEAPSADAGPLWLHQALLQRGISLGDSLAGGKARGDRQLETELMLIFRDTRREEAFEALYRAARPALLAWIVRLCTSRHATVDPAELLQDTFVNVYRYASSFRSGSGQTFRAWAFTIAANVLRRSLRAPLVPRALALPTGLREPPDGRLGPAESVESREERERLVKAWALLLLHYAAAADHLAPRDRRALEMIEVEGLSYAEAGRRLRVGSSNMKMIMFRSRKRIRRHLMRAMQDAATEHSLRHAG